MDRSYLRKRRIIEETYGPPGEVGDVEDLNADEAEDALGEPEEDLDGDDHDLGDPE